MTGCAKASSSVPSSQTSSAPASSVKTSSAKTSSVTPSSKTSSSVSSSKGNSSESSSSSAAAVAPTYAITAVDLVKEDNVIYFTAAGTYTGTLTQPVIKIDSGADIDAALREHFTGEIIPVAASLTFTCKVNITAMADTSWHDIKIYLDGTAASATGEIDKNVLTDEMYAKTLVDYSAVHTLTYGFNNWENNLKLTLTYGNLYTATAIDLTTDSDNKAYFNVSGTYDSHLGFSDPAVMITSDPNTTATKESYTGSITMVSTPRTFSAKVEVTDMTDPSWHDIKLYFSSTGLPATGEIDKTLLTDSTQYSKTLEVPDATGKKVFSFESYNNMLKIKVVHTDNLVTTYSSLYLATEADGAYLHLSGKNTHTNAKFYIGTTAAPLVSTDVPATGDFDVKVRVDNVADADTVYASNAKIDLRFQYTQQDGTTIQNDEITNVNLADHVNLPGTSYGTHNYVFTKSSWETTTWYKLTRTDDSFVMDTAILSKDETDTANPKAMLNVRGIINITKPLTLGAVTLKLNGDANDVDGTTILESFDIPSTSITANGYLNATIDITAMTSTGAASGSHLGGMQIWNDTTMLNNFWQGDWSHGNDVLSVTVGSYKYVLNTYGWGEYSLDKVAA